ncbi:MAG: hypothetical protein AMS27_13920 [Bacteroides sp. SM23_62_1]|nr:MAG: hypothetical protein AMS27_13920 [Bacteroides sp. SM23_62_1]
MHKEFTFKHKLNRFLKPVVDPQNSDIKMYPVYCQVIYERQNYLFPSVIKSHYTEIGLVVKEDENYMIKEKNFITNLIHYELNEKKQHFNLRGLGKKYTNYRTRVQSYWNEMIRSEIKKIVRRINSKYYDVFHFDNKILDAGILHEAIGLLIPELNELQEFQQVGEEIRILREYKNIFPESGKEPFIYPAFFHWLSEGHSEKIIKKLTGRSDIDQKIISDIVSLMNRNIRLATVDAMV